MIRIKRFSIQEGHYTGSKKLKKVPSSLNTITKSVLAGLGIGTLIGSTNEKIETKDAAKKGVIAGLAFGVLSDFLIKRFHNPMSSVKYDKIDKYLRMKLEISDKFFPSKANGKNLEDRFSFNDSEFTKYKINISILKDSISMYISDFSSEEINKVDNILNDYCYKYFGMEYSSRLLNKDNSSYSISITFTNYEVISSFLIDISNSLNLKINLLNDRVPINLSQEEITLKVEPIKINKEKIFSKSSLPLFDKYDLIKIFGKGGIISILSGPKGSLTTFILESLKESANLLYRSYGSTSKELKVLGFQTKRSDLDNKYLEKCLKNLGYHNGFNYTIGEDSSALNLMLLHGELLICFNKNSSISKNLSNFQEKFGAAVKTEISKKAILYKVSITSETELKKILTFIINQGIKPNIYTR